MLLEGEVDWTLIFAILAAVGFGLAIFAGIAAVRNGHRGRHVSTHLDRAKQTAASTDRRLFDILNAIPVALVQTDVQGKFVFANRAAHQLLGRRDVELLGLRFHSATWGITFPDGRPIPPDMLPTARALRGQTVKGFQHLLANPSTRRKMLVSVTAMPILDEMDQVIGSTAAVVETEGLTTPEPMMGEVVPMTPPVEDPMVRRLFDAAPEALVVVSPHGLVREANRAAQALTVDAVLDADFADRFVAEADRTAARQLLRAGFTSSSEAGDLIAPTGEGRVFEWTLTPLLDSRGRTDALVLSGRPAAVEPEEAAPDRLETSAPVEIDSTIAEPQTDDLAQAEALPERHQEAGRYEDIGRLTAGLTQEFGALLSVMTGAVQMMAEQAEHPDKVRRLAEAALGAGRRGEGLTRRISAVTTDGAPLTEQTLDVGGLLLALEGRLRSAYPDIDLMIETPAEAVLARLDPTGFEAVTEALVLNAVQAGARAVGLRISQLGDQAVISVRDNGCGMDAEVLKRASEPFFSTRPGAAGLGLSHATAYARGAGGGLEVRSTADEGSEIVLALPLAATSNAA